MERVISKTKYSRKQHKKFYFFHLFHRSHSTYFMMVLTAVVIFLAIYSTINNPQDISNILLMWAFAAFSILFIPLMMIHRINSIVKKETAESKESTDTIEVTKDKIQRSNTAAIGKAVVGWRQIEAVCETEDTIYLYTGPDTGLFIVKADIVEGDVETFRKLAMQNMTKNKRGKVKYKKYFKEKK